MIEEVLHVYVVVSVCVLAPHSDCLSDRNEEQYFSIDVMLPSGGQGQKKMVVFSVFKSVHFSSIPSIHVPRRGVRY